MLRFAGRFRNRPAYVPCPIVQARRQISMKPVKSDQSADTPSSKGFSGLTRRGWLRNTAWLIAAGALSRATAWAAAEISPVMEKLSAYMMEARNRELPEKALRETEHHILDTFAAMVSGSDLLPGREAIKFARNYGGQKVATVVASKVLCGPIEAALANGQLAHSDESDDDYTAGGAHPGCAVVPAVLAVGEQFGISGAHFMRAVVLGYDIGPRVTMTLGGQRFEDT